MSFRALVVDKAEDALERVTAVFARQQAKVKKAKKKPAKTAQQIAAVLARRMALQAAAKAKQDAANADSDA